MKYRLLSISLGALLLLCAGCRLARPEAAEQAADDRLIGAFVTFDYVDAFDFDAWAQDNVDALTGGGDMALSEAEAAAYEGRVWAAETEDGDFVFDGLDGVGFYCPVTGEGDSLRRGSHLDPGLVSDGMHYTVTDGGEGVELDCTLYVTPRETIKTFCNPVYQTAGGQVYLISGSGMNTNTLGREGQVYSSTLNDTCTVTVDGESRTDSCDLALHVAVMYEPTRITVIQMDENSQALDRRDYEPGALPESLTLEPGCAYVIAETHKLDEDGEPTVARELIDIPGPGGDNAVLTTYHTDERGLFIPQDTTLTETEANP